MHPYNLISADPHSGPVRKLLLFGDGPLLMQGLARHDGSTLPHHYYQREENEKHSYYTDNHGLYLQPIDAYPRAEAILMFVLPSADDPGDNYDHMVAQCTMLVNALIKYRNDCPNRAFDNAGLVVVAPDYDPCDSPSRYDLTDNLRELYQRINPERVAKHVGIYVVSDVAAGLRLVNLIMGESTGDETSKQQLDQHRQGQMTRR